MGLQQDSLRLLETGEIDSAVLSPWGSNYTFMVSVRDGSQECRAVYKPRDGEIPLWDFPRGTLYKRETAAYLLSRILGWDFIPPTLIREGPYGVGSIQLFVDHNPKINYFAIRELDPDSLRITACFDLLANNADRKPGHCIRDVTGKVWGIDHGLTFNEDLKVRTVIWDFGGEPIPELLMNRLSQFLEELENPTGPVKELLSLLDGPEVEALILRTSWLLEIKEFPALPRRRLYVP